MNKKGKLITAHRKTGGKKNHGKHIPKEGTLEREVLIERIQILLREGSPHWTEEELMRFASERAPSALRIFSDDLQNGVEDARTAAYYIMNLKPKDAIGMKDVLFNIVRETDDDLVREAVLWKLWSLG